MITDKLECSIAVDVAKQVLSNLTWPPIRVKIVQT